MLDISLTDNAIKHVEKYLQKRAEGIGIRVKIEQTGCSGYAYVVDYVDAPLVNDKIFQVKENLSVMVDPDSFEYIKGSQIDYVVDGLTGRFEFINPNQTGMCGCGESFTINED